MDTDIALELIVIIMTMVIVALVAYLRYLTDLDKIKQANILQLEARLRSLKYEAYLKKRVGGSDTPLESIKEDDAILQTFMREAE